MSKRYSGKSFKDSSVSKKAKFSLKEKRKIKKEKEILNAPNYALSRLINGKDLNTFLSLSNMPNVYQNAADGFDLEQFRNTNLGKKLQPLGVLG